MVITALVGRTAIGDEEYVDETKRRLSSMAIGRKIVPNNSVYELRGP